MEAGGGGADATMEDPFRRRLRFRRTSTVRPVHTKAPTKIRLTD